MNNKNKKKNNKSDREQQDNSLLSLLNDLKPPKDFEKEIIEWLTT